MTNVVELPKCLRRNSKVDALLIIKYCRSGKFTDEELLDFIEKVFNVRRLEGGQEALSTL